MLAIGSSGLRVAGAKLSSAFFKGEDAHFRQVISRQEMTRPWYSALLLCVMTLTLDWAP